MNIGRGVTLFFGIIVRGTVEARRQGLVALIPSFGIV